MSSRFVLCKSFARINSSRGFYGITFITFVLYRNVADPVAAEVFFGTRVDTLHPILLLQVHSIVLQQFSFFLLFTYTTGLDCTSFLFVSWSGCIPTYFVWVASIGS